MFVFEKKKRRPRSKVLWKEEQCVMSWHGLKSQGIRSNHLVQDLDALEYLRVWNYFSNERDSYPYFCLLRRPENVVQIFLFESSPAHIQYFELVGWLFRV